jgi:hypothetical protein
MLDLLHLFEDVTSLSCQVEDSQCIIMQYSTAAPYSHGHPVMHFYNPGIFFTLTILKVSQHWYYFKIILLLFTLSVYYFCVTILYCSSFYYHII